tara:strand:- start:734 stop:991 length:258 start_codon:yes stop_codon:yes gene_type:complete
MKRTVSQSIRDLEVIRQALCSYHNKHGVMCDCKFGVHHLPNKGFPVLPRGENGCGCPELYQAIYHLKRLAELEGPQKPDLGKRII